MFSTTALAFLFVCLSTIYWYLKRTYLAIDDRTKKIPGLKPEWLFGNVRNTGILSGKKVLHEVFAEFKKKYGDVFSFRIGTLNVLVLSRIEHAQHVLTSRQLYDVPNASVNRPGLVIPTSLVALLGNDWKRHVRFVHSMFRRTKAMPYLDKIVDCVDCFISERFVHQDGNIHTDLVVQCQRLLINILTRTAFDYDPQQSSLTEPDIQQVFYDYGRYMTTLLIGTGLPFWVDKLFVMLHWKAHRVRRMAKQYIMKKIVEEQNRQEQQNCAQPNVPESMIASVVAMIKEKSLSSKDSFLTPDEIFDELSLATLAVFDGMSAALSWFIFYISKYPESQQKIKQELKKHFSKSDAPLTLEILDSLIYIEYVMKEVFRFAPIETILLRQAICDDMIDDIPVKKGDQVGIAVQNLHHDSRYWNVDPLKFVPERFIEKDISPPHCANLFFGAGHRACAARELAFFEMKIVITRLMQRVTIEDPGEEANNSGGFLQKLNCFPKYVAVRVCVD
ncbi:unnamed protein product [Rotaria magnacalcarata]|uniref:Cytochrome P450 n=2 Tax=Rotaria magnacalcarata TaxID=392030 RepID=A0A815LGQ5_9BILA|nr:unnamed protein product [Rotaria magnacalcarata]CAF1498186.1 unnamed protein product [Rotaria magnacalcarata]CAF1968360.1 unnamed protein product [Rotaria magnacalcarata]CAF2155822.1 unnamed protein product [Rotaria magnacalcarata]CAF4166214.1 unnamed protein product [Rotaria magnacalcarata]